MTERLIELHAEGKHNIRQMMRILIDEFHTPLTKNAVIGKLHRLKLQTPQTATKTKKKKAKPKPAPPRAAKPRPKPEATVDFVYYPPPQAPLIGLSLSIYELTSRTCKFPTSGSGESCRFCGLKSKIEPYCAYHHRVAIVPAAKRWK